MSRSRTPLIIPSEIQNREFDAKLLLACLASERGFRSIVGCRTDIHLRIADLPRGIYVAKDVRKSSRRMFGILGKLGCPVVALDEEAPFFYSREFYLEARVSEKVLHETRELYAWGPENAEAWRHCPYYHGAPVHETGNPRVDMMRPELRGFFDAEVAALRERLGRFILVNTNFGSLNHFFPNLSTLLPPDMTGGSPPDADGVFKANLAAHRHGIFRSFLEMVPRLARAFPTHTIVLRPHPAENHDTWRQAGAGCDNFRVIHQGPVTPWLLAADAVIHNSCTTGFEAYLVGAPVIAYRPAVSDQFDLALPNELSHQAFDADTLLDMAGAATRDEVRMAEAERTRRHALAERHVSALDGTFAGDRIVDRLDRFEAGTTMRRSVLNELAGQMAALIRRKGKERNAAIPGHKNHNDYTRHRFPGIELTEVNERIERLKRILGRFPSARARSLGENIFEVSAA